MDNRNTKTGQFTEMVQPDMTGLPSAPERDDREQKFKKVNLDIEGDGIDDDTHKASIFLKDMGTGCPGLNPPDLNKDSTWPPLPDEVRGIHARFFRRPDFVTDGADANAYRQQFLAKAGELGWVFHRNGLEKLVRGVGGVLTCCTGVGAIWVGNRYKRIHVGDIGFCTDINESARLLMPGHHCEYNPTHGSVQTFSIVKDYIRFMNRVHIVRVHPGEYVVVKINDQYSLLEPGVDHSVGVHMFDDPKFEFVSRVKQTSPAILAGPINIITVPPGRLARILIQNKPFILFEGQHRITSGLLEFGERILSAEDRAERKGRRNPNQHQVDGDNVGFSHLKDTFLYHSIGKIYVKPGEVRGVQVNRRAVFLEEPGDYWFYSDQIEMMAKPSLLTDEFVEFSCLLRVYIKENECGVVQKQDGSLEILENGCHVIEMPNRYLVSMPKTVQFREVRNSEGITLDPFDVVFNFTMAYKIVQPFKAYLVGAQMVKCHAAEAKSCNNDMFRTIDNTIRTSCMRTMKEIVRHLVFKDTMLLHRMSKEELGQDGDDMKGSAGEVRLHELQDDALQPGSLKSQFQNVSRGAVKLLAKTLLEVFGVELLIGEFGISQLDLKNQAEQNELNRAAFEAAKARAIIVKAENDKKKAEVDKERVEIMARTKVAQQMIDAESRGRITELNSEAKAREIERLAAAEAKAIRVKAEAEGFAKEQFEDRTALQMAEIVAGMFKGTNLTVMDSSQGQIGALLHRMIGGLSSGKDGSNPFCLPRVNSGVSQQ